MTTWCWSFSGGCALARKTWLPCQLRLLLNGLSTTETLTHAIYTLGEGEEEKEKDPFALPASTAPALSAQPNGARRPTLDYKAI